MHQFKFIIPQKLDDLLHPQEDPNVFYVNDELTSLEVAQRLPSTECKLREDPLAISEEFEVFFSVLKNINEIDTRTVDRTWQIAFKTTNSFKEQLREIFSVLNDTSNVSTNHNKSGADEDHQAPDHLSTSSQENRVNLFESLQEKLRFSNSLKMLIYINCSFIQHYEDALASQSHRQNFNDSYNADATPNVRKKKNRRDNEKNVSFKEYDRYKANAVRNLLHLTLMPLSKIADTPTEARDIVGQIMRICYKMIENSAFNGLAKYDSKELLEYNFILLGTGIQKYNQSLSFCLKFIQLLQYREQLAPLLADLVEFIVTKHDQKLLIGEILREIDRIDIKDLSRDSSCPRAVSTFLVNLSEKCSREFIALRDHLFDYLEQDSYIMRNASLSVITNIIANVLQEKDDEKVLRDELLGVLSDHIQDITGYTRSKCLSLWCHLSEKKCIPTTYIAPVLKRATLRLRDKSCLVRKNALRFIICSLCYNPYGKKLKISKFEEILKKEEKKLEELKGTENEKLSTVLEESLILNKSKNQEKATLSNGVASTDERSQPSETTELEEASDTQGSQPTQNHKTREIALTEETPISTQIKIVNYLKDVISFTRQIHQAIPYALAMLTTKNISDTQEAIDFFVQCHEFGIDEALVGFKKMIMLINVQEKSVKDTVSSAYKKIFFDSSRYEGITNRNSLVVSNFISFIQEATVGEASSLEILLAQFLESGDFSREMERELWARFTKTKGIRNQKEIDDEESIASIQLIGMLASAQPEIISHNLQLCVQYGLAGDGCGDQQSKLIRETCVAIGKSMPKKIEDKRRPLRLAMNDEMFKRLEDILVDSIDSMDSLDWASMCDEAIKILFAMAELPEQICDIILRRMVEKLLKNSIRSDRPIESNRNESPELVFQPSTMQGTTLGSSQNPTPAPTEELVHPIVLARYIHCLGVMALNLAVFLETNVLLELKIRNALTNGGDVSNGNINAHNISAHNLSISSRRRSRRYGASNKSIDEQNLEEEIGLGGAEAEDAEMEFIGQICDEEIVCGKNLLGQMSRVIIEVVMDPDRYPNLELKLASSLALAKYMMVSAKYCHGHLRLLFTILEKTKHKEVKTNLLTAISDLCIRFPNQLDGWTGKIFECLDSKEVEVRRTALKILSRLVLSDILKAKDQISTMANLIVDKDEQISSSARLFFTELSKKLNAIYNVLPDIISRLSDSKTGITIDKFKIVMKFIFELIDKSHHIDRLVDKLCGRFMDTVNERHWCDLAYCLTLLKYSDKSIVKLFDKFDCYKDKLCIDSVHESISSIIQTYRKSPHLKNEIKQMLDEFEAKVAKCVCEEKEEEEGAKEDQMEQNQEQAEEEEDDDDDDDDTVEMSQEEVADGEEEEGDEKEQQNEQKEEDEP